jgi:hypothetical protein
MFADAHAVQLNENACPSSAYVGWVMLNEPVNGDPSLQLAITVATVVPDGVLAGMLGAVGLKTIFRVGALGTKTMST